jgi:dTDP-4-dehydrorhamnose 3,5-epimerase
METETTSLPGVILISPKVFRDGRGFFFESYNKQALEKVLGPLPEFVQDNHSSSQKGVLRGLHYQVKRPQGKLLRVVRGSVFDVAVDLRKSSPAFGKWCGFILSDENQKMAWIPPGFAHGFLALSEACDFVYKCTDYWFPEHDRCLLYNDPDVGIEWPSDIELLLSKKDREGKKLAETETFP